MQGIQLFGLLARSTKSWRGLASLVASGFASRLAFASASLMSDSSRGDISEPSAFTGGAFFSCFALGFGLAFAFLSGRFSVILLMTRLLGDRLFCRKAP